jgi:hypothetical protein
MISMIISYIRLKKTTQNNCDTINSEYTVLISKYELSKFPQLPVYIISYYVDKTLS